MHFCLFAFSANAAGLGEPCIADADCIDSVYCNGIESCSSEGSICVAGIAVDCADQICDELSQGCVECLEDLDCADNATPFCSDRPECVECLKILTALTVKYAIRVCAPRRSPVDCSLSLRYSIWARRASGPSRCSPSRESWVKKALIPMVLLFSVPSIFTDPFVAGNSDVLKVQILVPGDVVIEGESFDVSVGSCVGQVYIKTPGFKDAEKEQKRLEQQERKEAKMAEKLKKKLEKEAKKGK